MKTTLSHFAARSVGFLALLMCLQSQGLAAGHPEKTRELIGILQSNAGVFEKARACQQLGEIGTQEAVPALAALLENEQLSAYARSGLEGIPDPTAAEALRAAASRLKGQQLIGAVNSLGVLRDGNAVGLLRQLAADPASGAAREALGALGRISTPESIQVVRETLEKGPEPLRGDAAAACLLAAEQQMADGQPGQALALCDAVREAKVPLSYRVGATRGAILARTTNGAPFLVEQLRSNELAIRNAALLTIREIPSDALASVLNAELGRAAPELQLLLLTAMVDCHNPQSIQAIAAATTSNNLEIRKTALTVLARLGGPAAAGILLQIVTENRNADEVSIASRGLRQMEGTAVDDLVLKALPTATGAEARVQLIRVTEARGLSHATPELMKLAAGSDEKVNQAALVALAALAEPQDLRALMVLTGSCTNSAVREAAGDAMVRVAARTGQTESAGEAALENLRRATNAQFRLSWISILTSLGYAKALPAIKEAMADLDETVAANAISQVGRWPDPAPVEDLLTVAEQAANPIHRRLALDSALQLVTVAADERQRPAEIIFSWLQRADKATQSAQFKRRILSALGRLKLMGSLSLAASYLKNTELQTEAAQAVIQIAPALVTQGDTGLLLEALETISATAQNPGIREQARNIAQSIPKESQPQQLFDGKTFDGWEGNLKLFRVEDGAIVAGNLKEPIPQNEFLCTRKEYDNFELRLKFKLLGQGANGGVQVRSQRIPNNHEMTGYQADMGDGWWGCLYDEGRGWKVLAGPAPADRDKIIRREDWNQYVIRCQGRRIQLWVNDQKTVDYTEPDASLPQRGVIGLQIHSGGPTEAWYKDIQLRPLPDKE